MISRREYTDKGRNSEDSSPISKASTALTKRTPARALSIAQRVPLPPSPAVLASQIDAQTSSMRTSISEYISASPIPGTLDAVRSNLSTVTSIELLALFVEAVGLRGEVLPLRYLTTIPAIPAIGTNELSIKIPNFFALLTMAFWGPVGLWVITSIALPLIGAYFINLKGEGYDALSFNATKALIAWVVYVRNGMKVESKAVVEQGVPGGSTGMFIGAGIGGLAALYEAVLKR